MSSKLAEQRAELAQTLVVYGKNHPTAKKLQSQVDELQSQLDGQKKAIVNSYNASYAAAEARERLMAAEMKGTTKEMGQMARYTALKKEVQTEVELYNSLVRKNQGSWHRGSFEVGQHSRRRCGARSRRLQLARSAY